ncbi:uncharacterized protein LOC144710634 [Wolffia australiana]
MGEEGRRGEGEGERRGGEKMGVWGKVSSLVLNRIRRKNKSGGSSSSSSPKRGTSWVEEQDQPSPVSVLEANLEDDAVSSPSPRFSETNHLISRSPPICSIARGGGAATAEEQRRQVESLLASAGFEEATSWREALARWHAVDPRMSVDGGDSSLRLIADAVDEAIQEAVAGSGGGVRFRERILCHVYGWIDGKAEMDGEDWKKALMAAAAEIRRGIEDEVMNLLVEEAVADVITR